MARQQRGSKLGRPKLGFTIEVDDRTGELSDEALFCRSRGHKWGDKGMTRKEYAQLMSDGLWADNLYCENGCGSGRKIIWSLRTGEILEEKREYPKGGDYLLKKNSGRLPRAAARMARGARQIAAYA